jgi:pimeloyl-ACP methyl ester carboxylesterase
VPEISPLIATLLRVSLLLTMMGALGVSAGLASARRPWAAVLALLLVGSWHLLLLMIEFALSTASQLPLSNPLQLATELPRAFLREARATTRLLCWNLPFASQRWPDQLPDEADHRRGLLLVHGFACNRGLWNPWLAKLTEQGLPWVAVDLETAFSSIDVGVPAIEAAVAALQSRTGLRPVIVAHSMGGLLVRKWMATPANLDRVFHVVTLATPHQGTWAARFALAPNLRQLHPRSTWLRALYASESLGACRKLTCYVGSCDNLVHPPSLGKMPGAENRIIAGAAHLELMEHPEPWEQIQTLLAETREMPEALPARTSPSLAGSS